MTNVTNAQRAEIIIHALPHIKSYNNKIVVVKYGGNAMNDDKMVSEVMRDIVLMSLIGIKVVLVHGGGPEISAMLKKIGKESKFLNGLRVTDAETMEIVKMVLAGKVNNDLISLIGSHGGRAVGLCGIDANMIMAKQQDPELGFVGEITSVNPKPIFDLLEKGYIPVIAGMGIDENGTCYNINADTAASKIAASLKAESMIAMTNISGILTDKDDPNSLIDTITVGRAKTLEKQGVIAGGMIPKVDCCVEAVEGGVKKVFIIDGQIPHAILIETLTDEGIGTMFVAG